MGAIPFDVPALASLYAPCGREVAPCDAFEVLSKGVPVFAPDAGWGDFEAIFGAEIIGDLSPHGDALLSVWDGWKEAYIIQKSRFPLMGFEYKIKSGHEKAKEI